MSNSNSREGEYPARVTACRSKDLNQSIKTAVISTSIALNNLMINYWLYPSLLLFHTFSLSVCLSGPLSSPTSFPLTKIRHRLQHESCRPVFGSVTGDFAAGATAPPFNRIFSLSLSLSGVFMSPASPIHCCYGTCQVATGTFVSPLILWFNRSVDSIQPDFMSEKTGSKTPRC